jgi:hypothetical protein
MTRALAIGVMLACACRADGPRAAPQAPGVTDEARSLAAANDALIDPADALLLRLGTIDFGERAPDIRVSGGAATLAPGGQRVGALELAPGATLYVDGDSAIEVRDRVVLGAGAAIVVRGRLRLYAHGRFQLDARAAIVQRPAAGVTRDGDADGARPDGLVLLLARTARTAWAPDAELGPALLYAPESTLAALPSFRGAVVAAHVTSAPGARFETDARYLRCPLDVTPPAIALARLDRAPPPGTRAVLITGTITDDAEVTATLSGAPLAIARDGTFRATAALLGGGEPTMVCVVARDCAGHTAEQCAPVAPRHAVELAVTAPAPGAELAADAAHVNVAGRFLGAAPLAVDANGVRGAITRGDAFVVPSVPLAPGPNVIVVRALARDGDVTTRRVLVARGALPAAAIDVAVDATRHATLEARYPRAPVASLPRATGHLQLRLVDASGAELYRAPLPGTAPFTFAQPYHAFALVPTPPDATAIEFLDEGGARIGGAPYP